MHRCGPIQIEIPLKGALSIENIRVNVPSVFTVAIGTEPPLMQNAAIRLLGLNTEAVKQQAEHIIFGQMRQVIASMRIEDINRHREQFLQRPHAAATRLLAIHRSWAGPGGARLDAVLPQPRPQHLRHGD